MSAALYRSVAANLDRIAVEVSNCDSTIVAPCRMRLPEVLQGAATPYLTAQLDECSGDLRVARTILTDAAVTARHRAEEIEAADAAAATEAAALEEAAAEETVEEAEDTSDPPIPIF